MDWLDTFLADWFWWLWPSWWDLGMLTIMLIGMILTSDDFA